MKNSNVEYDTRSFKNCQYQKNKKINFGNDSVKCSTIPDMYPVSGVRNRRCEMVSNFCSCRHIMFIGLVCRLIFTHKLK
jgi:hypothetical protein